MQNSLDADTGLHYFPKYSIRLKGHSVKGGLQKVTGSKNDMSRIQGTDYEQFDLFYFVCT